MKFRFNQSAALRRRFARAQVATSRNVGCFLRLQEPHHDHSYLIHRRKITKISPETQRSYSLGNTEHHAKNTESIREHTKTTTGMHQPDHNHEIKKKQNMLYSETHTAVKPEIQRHCIRHC